MTGTGEYDPSEMALEIAETEAGARYFADMAQVLQGSLTWDAERMGDLYPEIIETLDAIAEIGEACGQCSERLEERKAALMKEYNAHRERKQISIRVPTDVYRDLVIYQIIVKVIKKRNWTVNGEVNEFLEAFVKEHRAEIDEFIARQNSTDTEE